MSHLFAHRFWDDTVSFSVLTFKAAKALGLDVPFLVQQRADEVIE
jgi:hypothetical protein